METLKVIKEFWPLIAAFGVLAGAGLYAWLSNRFVSQKDHNELQNRVDSLEKTVERLPSHEQIQQLIVEVAETRVAADETRNFVRSIDRKYDMLLENELRGEKS